VALERALKQQAHEVHLAEEAAKQPEDEIPGLRIVPST
jgi:hypothetical protein